ncbi:DNA-directed RNA polymerase III subunit RPC5 isoform X2 [Abrus precatorius]|uniref:DNA-directed RNA polymerase III subunit RPC5 isoform X2 n=1 Tax=Abrus precatorius TaxID=3816 RepID=A0A8B8JJV7_ABRPR|nr:DNA-directed RNA polymerase III subunit RPC5 isoform X2 [Abrus precatorius]
MDLEDLEAPGQVPSRVSKFAPKSSKLKPKPKSEPAPRPEPEPQPSSSKPEPPELDLPVKKNEDEVETVASTHSKPEPNGAVTMDVEPKSETEGEAGQGQGDPMDEDSAEDTVVREIDVFFSPSIDADTQLYVFQYPLRPCWRPYDLDEQCEEVRLKPDDSQVEVDLSIDLESNNIDKEFADKYNITKQTLSTSWKPPHANGCAVGILMGDKLHLHPVHAVVQLRPSLQHLNSGESKRKNIIPSGASANVKIEGSVEEKSVSTSKKQNKLTEPSIEQKNGGDECWIPLKYHSCKSDISSRYLQQMMAQEGPPIDFNMTAYDYVTALCPGVSSNILPKGPSKRYLLSLFVEERLKKLLIEGRPLHRFSAIKHYAPEYSEDQLLGFLQQHAILVRGLWTAKSALLYPQGGVETLARDYALLLFSKNLKVQLSDVNVRGELGNYVRNFLKIFGLERFDINKSTGQSIPNWKFRELPDESFKKLHPNIVEKQEEVFKGLDRQLSSFASNVGKRKLGKNAVANPSMNNELVKSENSDQRGTSLSGGPPGKMTMSNETRHALPIALKKLFQTHKVCSFQMICQGLREMAVSKTMLSKGDSKIAVDAAHSLDGPHDELKAIISEVACDIHGYYVLKSSQDDPFRDVVIDMLRGNGPSAKLKKAEIVEAARRKLGREVINNEYIKGILIVLHFKSKINSLYNDILAC